MTKLDVKHVTGRRQVIDLRAGNNDEYLVRRHPGHTGAQAEHYAGFALTMVSADTQPMMHQPTVALAYRIDNLPTCVVQDEPDELINIRSLFVFRNVTSKCGGTKLKLIGVIAISNNIRL